MIIFQIGRLICDNCICRRMRLVKCVLCEIDHLIVDFICNLLRNSICHASRNVLFRIAVDKILALSLHHIRFFLTHRTAQKVTSPQRISGQIPHDLHNLFLINDTAVCRFQDRLQLRAVIGGKFRVILSFYILRNEIHRPRAVQRDSRDNIFQTLRLQFLHEALHPRTFQLEDSVRLAASQKLHHRRVIVIQLFRNDPLSGTLLHQVDRILNHSQCAQSQKIHFQKSQFFQCSHGKLSDHRIIRPQSQRNEFVYIFLADYNTCRMHGCMSRQTFQAL